MGESGSGKSVTVLALLGLIPCPPGNIVGGTVHFDGEDLLVMEPKQLRKIRGRDIGMIFQDAMTALNPVFTVGSQITEALQAHTANLSDKAATERAIELLALVGVPGAKQRFKQYPHEYSGGMRQRAMIAMAIANRPRLLIADEPTTALDVTIQALVLEVLNRAKEDANASTILITHDLGVIAEMADRVAVMYAGKIVGDGDSGRGLHGPATSIYDRVVDESAPSRCEIREADPDPRQPPNASDFPTGCRFHDRCDLRNGRDICTTDMPDLIPLGPGRASRCHFPDEVSSFADTRRAQMEIESDTEVASQ